MIRRHGAVILILVLGMLLIHGCERDVPRLTGINCAECYQDKPEWGPLNVRLTINDENPFVPMVIYEGYIEDEVVEWVDTSWEADYWVDVPVNKYYSVSAKYLQDGDTIYVIDGDRLKLKHTTEECDEPCYYFKGGYFDLQLKD